TRLALFTLVVNVVLNLALIPPYSYLGAAAASTITEVALFAGGWWLLRRHLASLSMVGSVARVLASAAIMGIVVYSFPSGPRSTWSPSWPCGSSTPKSGRSSAPASGPARYWPQPADDLDVVMLREPIARGIVSYRQDDPDRSPAPPGRH